MALVPGACIDRYEGSLVELTAQGEKLWPHNLILVGGRTYKAVSAAGRKPQAYISADQAAAACSQAGKRLCSIKEWVKACQGPLNTQYPYGGTYQAGVCNEHSHDAKHVSPMFKLFGQKPSWDMAEMNDPRLDTLPDTVAPAGSFSGCTNGYGVYDMVGNVHEWTADRAGSRGMFKGGYFNEAEINGPGCRYTTSAHGASYHDYSTGFRCCADAQ
jgi:formylglycine-generating enzyme required for sulfatase activity